MFFSFFCIILTFSCGLVTFTEEILNGKLYFLCSVNFSSMKIITDSITNTSNASNEYGWKWDSTYSSYEAVICCSGINNTLAGNKISRKLSFRLRVVYAMLTLHKRFFVSLKCFCQKEVISFQSSPKKIISESKRFVISPFFNCHFFFLFFAFIVESVSKMQVLPCKMVDIFCTFCDCNDYNFTSFSVFTKRSSVTFVYMIFCCVVFNS